MLGTYISVGDDCIAIKSGKIYMAQKEKTPTEDMTVRQCCMRDGHGAVTVGSEIAAGVKDVHIRDCMFMNTDRRQEEAVVNYLYLMIFHLRILIWIML